MSSIYFTDVTVSMPWCSSKFTLMASQIMDVLHVHPRYMDVVSMSDFQPEGRWFKPGLWCCVVSLDKKLFSMLSLSQVYK